MDNFWKTYGICYTWFYSDLTEVAMLRQNADQTRTQGILLWWREAEDFGKLRSREPKILVFFCHDASYFFQTLFLKSGLRPLDSQFQH